MFFTRTHIYVYVALWIFVHLPFISLFSGIYPFVGALCAILTQIKCFIFLLKFTYDSVWCLVQFLQRFSAFPEKYSDQLYCKDVRRQDSRRGLVLLHAPRGDEAPTTGKAVPSRRAGRSWRSTVPSRAAPNGRWPFGGTH